MDETTRVEINRLWDESKRQNKRIDNLEDDMKDIKQIAISVERLAVQMESMTKAITNVSTDIEELKNRPAHAWNTVTLAAITAVVSLIIGNLLPKIM